MGLIFLEAKHLKNLVSFPRILHLSLSPFTFFHFRSTACETPRLLLLLLMAASGPFLFVTGHSVLSTSPNLFATWHTWRMGLCTVLPLGQY